MIVVAKCYCTTALSKSRRRGSYCFSILFYLLLLTAALTAAISAEVIYSAIFIQKKMRCTMFAAAPTAAAVAATAATAAAAAVVSFRFYDYSPSNATIKPKPR
jgi:SNF family Na+-dependent transporter